MAQKGIIKEVKEVAQEGKRTFFAVKLEDGAEMSTFDAKIKEAQTGDTIEFDAVIKGRYVNLKDGFIITKKTSSVAVLGSQASDTYCAMSSEEIASIEARVAIETIAQLALAPLDNINKESRLGKSVDKALDWCEAKIDASMKTSVKAPTKSTTEAKAEPKEHEEKVEGPIDARQFKDAGSFLTACAKPRPEGFEYNRSKVCEKLEIKEISEISDFDEAWNKLMVTDLFEEPEP